MLSLPRAHYKAQRGYHSDIMITPMGDGKYYDVVQCHYKLYI